jgi:hypothetical protein
VARVSPPAAAAIAAAVVADAKAREGREEAQRRWSEEAFSVVMPRPESNA